MSVRYEYAVQSKLAGTWQTVTSGIYSLDNAKKALLRLNIKNPNNERRIVRRPTAKWEVVKE